MLVPKTYQYYPTIPLSDLSDLYSVGDNKLGTKRICIISHLPKILRIGVNLPITNKYVLFVEGTEQVDTIKWSVKLYNKGELLDNPADLRSFHGDTNNFQLLIDSAFYSGAGQKLFDRMKISCVVKKGANETTLEIEHSLVEMFDILDLMNANDYAGENDPSKKLYISNPDTTNYLLNCLNDYVTEENLTWNQSPILSNPAERDNLLSTVISIVYHNILNAFSMEFAFCVDLDEFDNKNINAHLNTLPAPAYDGSFRNGICRLPLHALNDALTDFTRVPDFKNISSTNPLYVILTGVGISNAVSYEGVSDFEDRVPEFVLPTIKAAKQRLYGDKNKLIELYNLSAFPKASIKLAVILVKFLFECSKKNQCNECFKKQVAWPTMGFHQIQDQPDFWKNILVHYFDGPSSEIKSFTRYAQSTFKLTGSQHVHLILHNSPRIVTAYFAKKVVKKSSVGVQCFFERIDAQAIRVGDDERRLRLQPAFDSILGRQFYLVVETLNCRDKELVCGVRSTDLSGNANNLNLVTGPNSWNLSDGSPVFEAHSDIPVFVGRHDALNSIAGDHGEYINVFKRPQDSKYNVDHLDKAIIKLNLRPDNQADFDAWATRLASVMTNLEITVQLVANRGTYYGNDPALSDRPGEFLNGNDNFDASARFRVVNRIVYEIFHVNNQHNFLSMNGPNRRRIGKTVNDFIATIADTDAANLPNRSVEFFYHDQNDNDHDLCTCLFFRPPRRANGVKIANTSVPANVPAGHTSDSAAPGGDAYWNYYYPNGDIVTRDNPATAGTDYGVIRYPLAGLAIDLAELVRLPGDLNKTFALDKRNRCTVTFAFSGTQRKYANPGCFAAFLGVLAELNYLNVESTGMCFQDATSYPSVTHPNGDSIDTRYLETPARRRAIISSFSNWNFSQVISGSDNIHVGDGAHLHNARHNDHLHSGNYLDANIHVITE